MPLDKDPQNGGTESDGVTKSEKYCSLCYADGKFLCTNVDNAQEFQKIVMEKMKENGWSRIMAWLLTRGIPRLERWQSASQ